jgi:hypothetical protein
MATLTTTIPPILNKSFTGASNQGQAAGWVAPTTGGDLIPVTGRGTIFRVKTAGTAITVTLNSVALSNYGVDQDVTMVLAATDEQEVFIANDGRFDQGGVNTGLMAVTYSASITTQLIAAKVIPGSV